MCGSGVAGRSSSMGMSRIWRAIFGPPRSRMRIVSAVAVPPLALSSITPLGVVTLLGLRVSGLLHLDEHPVVSTRRCAGCCRDAQRDVLRLDFFHCLLLVVVLRLGVAVWAGGRNAAAHQVAAIAIDRSQSGAWFGLNHEAARIQCSTGDGGAASGGSTRPPDALGPDEALGCRVR